MPRHPIIPETRTPSLAGVTRDLRDITYGPTYFQGARHDHGKCNVLAGELIYTLFRPSSVVDWGCGGGYVLHPLLLRGVRCLGLDVSESAFDFARELGGDPLAACIQIANLNDDPRPIIEGYDIALAIESLEHIAPESTVPVVEAICRSAPLVIISSPPPSGKNNPLHTNERLTEEWVEIFGAAGYEPDKATADAVRAAMRSVRTCSGVCVPSWWTSSYLGVYRAS